MTTIRILPLGDDVEAAPGATVMGAAQAAGYYWPTTCGGEGRCTTCASQIEEGADALSGMGKAERASLVGERGEGILRTNWRLACQARIEREGLVVVRKPGVRRPEE